MREQALTLTGRRSYGFSWLKWLLSVFSAVGTSFFVVFLETAG